MDFSANVDPSLLLNSPLSSSSSLSSVEYLTQHDFDLFDGLEKTLYPGYSTMVETIEPSQLTDSPGSSSWSSGTSFPSSPSSPEYTPLSTPPPEPAKRHYKRKSNTAVTTPSHEHDHDDEHRVKRHQTKLACSWCRKLSKKCDAQRPCARCVQFDRCDECVDAPPRRPRQRGVDRGTYKKTRDLAAVDYDQAIKQREAYVEKVRRKGRVVELGLTADAILDKTRQDDARFERQTRRQQSRRLSSESLTESSWSSDSCDGMMETMDTVEQTVIPAGVEVTKEAIAEQGGFIPFTGPLEDLFTCSATPEMDDLSSPASPASPWFDMWSPPSETPSPTEDDSDFGVMTPEATWDWQAWEQYPNVMKLITSTQVVETPYGLESEELNCWTDIALAA